ncbi:hypothetical protein [Lentilactobacillus diolivorans]|nr:hypothetical protein [Lentilactobacillus diolivorans]GEP25110.1 hypothetical protein LDI01_27030 [Lentilactobacillus diolivorans]
MTMTTIDATYQDIFKTVNGKVYLAALTKVDKLTSGQSFLYGKQGAHSMVIDIRLTEPIDQSILQQALNHALKRYPYLTSKMVLKNSSYFLAYNKLPMVVTQTEELRRLGGPETNFHLVDVTFDQQRLFVSYHHALADGRGIMPFVNTLLYDYFSIKNQQFPEIPGINLDDDPMEPDEIGEPFEYLPPVNANSADIPEIDHHGHQLIETKYHLNDRSYRHELVIDQASFMKYAKAHDATPAIAVSIMVSQAIQQIYPDISDPIVTNMASDLRSGIMNEHTFRNCVGSVALPINTEVLTDDQFTEAATHFRSLIRAHKAQKSLRVEANKMACLFKHLDNLSTFTEKQKMMAFIDHVLLNTFVLSYSGQTKLGKYESYIDEMHTYMSGTNGLSIEMLATNGKIFVDMSQSFNSDVYAVTLAKILRRNGIKYQLGEPTYFKTPVDELAKGDR